MATSPFDLMPNKDMGKAFGALSDSSQAEAVTNPFDESKGVAGRANAITSYGGPLMTAARTRAKQKMVANGLQNTSLAGQAGEQAVIETATPIAAADAQLYQTQQLANQQAQNQANLANANNRMQVGLTGLNLGENSRQFDTTATLERDRLNTQKDQFGQNLVEQKRQFDTSTGLNQQQFADNLKLQQDNLTAQREQFAQKLGLDTAQLQLSRDQLSQQDKQFLADLDAKEKQLAQQESQFTRDQASKVTLAGMDAASREKLLALESSYKKDIAGNDNISRAWGTMMESIDRIQNNPDLDASTKATMIANTQAGFQGFTNFWKKVSGGTTDVSDLLNFGPANVAAPGPGASQDNGNAYDRYRNEGGGS